MIKFIAKDRTDSIFLVIQEKVCYLLHYEMGSDSFGSLCPCCICRSVRPMIMAAIGEVQQAGLAEGKVRWCCHQGTTDYGDHIDGNYDDYGVGIFCAGNAETDISVENKKALRADCVARLSRQSMEGASKRRR